MALLFLKGLIMGVIIALPFGPVGLLCLQRSIYGGVLVGILSGVGAALADAFYGGIAAFGLRFLSDYLTSHHFVLQLVGGVFLLAMGVKMYLDRSEPKPIQAAYHKLAGAMASIFLLALTNPMTVVAFLAIFAGFGLGGADKDFGHGLAVVLGVFAGSMVWWVLIAFGGTHLRERITHRMASLKKTSGATVSLFGVWAFIEAFLK
jgi:putative LysE/RhtB family amino acid efflux pump